MDSIDGVCYIQHLTDPKEIEEWVKHDDHFYVNQEGDLDGLNRITSGDLMICKTCHKSRTQALQRREELRRHNSPLRTMELFSGT